MLVPDGSDAGTFLNPDGDFTADGTDAGTFTIGHAPITVPVWVDGDAESTPDIDRVWGWVTGYDLPLTASDGPMRIDVGVAQ